MMATLQENTKVLNQFLSMFAQLIPSTSATVAAQQGLAPPSPVIAAPQHTSQALQSSNPPVGNEGVIPRVEESALVTLPAVIPPPRHNHGVGDAGIQPGGSSSSHAALQHVIHATTTATPVEAVTYTPRGLFVTKDDLDVYLKEIQQKSSARVLDLKLPYNQRIAAKPYPKDYVSPKFMLFNGKKESAKEHLLKFIETLEVYGLDDDLKLKEFSKSLTENAYTWYVNLPPGSVDSWGSMYKMFLEKFFST